MASQEIQHLLKYMNLVNKVLERVQENVTHCWSNIISYSDDERALLLLGKEGLKCCDNRFKVIKGRIEQLINERLGLKKDVMRVIVMKSELDTEVYECMICLALIERADMTWSCSSCYNVLHLACVKQHAIHELLADYENVPRGVWKCPVCRHTQYSSPALLQYTCFCGAVISPRPAEGVTAHGCGRHCQRSRHCKMECHPAACPVHFYV